MERFWHWFRPKRIGAFISILLLLFSVLLIQTAYCLTASIGKPARGYLAGGIPFPPQFRGYFLRDSDRTYTTPEVIGALLDAIEGVMEEYPNTCNLYLGDFSLEEGGPMSSHKSHQNGRDVDLGMYAKENRPLKGFIPMNRENLDVPKTWSLIDHLLRSQRVQYIFVDREIQELLYEYALSRGFDEGYLDTLFKNVGSGYKNAIIQHLSGHSNHLHVRFLAPWSTLAGQLKKIDAHKQTVIELAQQAYLPKKVNYYVQGNEGSLFALAKSFGVSSKDLLRWNSLHGSEVLTPGSCLVFYKRGFESEPVRLAQSLQPHLVVNNPPPIRLASLYSEASALPDIPKSSSSRASAVEKKEAKPAMRTITYKVQKGDTLTKIAKKHSVDVKTLSQLNGLAKNPNLRHGQQLKIVVAKNDSSSTSTSSSHTDSREQKAPKVISYAVQRGDTLLAIAAKHNTNMEDLCVLNGIKRDAVLRSGQKLKVVLAKTGSLTVSDASPPAKEASGGNAKESKPSKVSTYTVQKGDTLLAIAMKHDTKVDALCQLNGFDRNTTLKQGQKLKVASAKADSSTGGKESSSSKETPGGSSKESKPSKTSTYTVQPGDTLLAIAMKHDTKVDALCQLNGFDRNTTLKQGQKLKVASVKADSSPAPDASPSKKESSAGNAKEQKPSKAGTHTVQSGDTLLAIAMKHDTKVDTICQLNGITRDTALKLGQELKLPSAKTQSKAASSQKDSGNQSRTPKPSKSATYKLQAGDTLWGVAKKHDTTPETLSKLNGLSAGATLKPGMEIKLPSK